MNKLALLWSLFTLAHPIVAAPFRNLEFEEANTNNLVSAVPSLPLYPAFRGTTTDLLAGWETSWGTDFSLNLFPLGLGYETLMTSRRNPIGLQLDGNYSLVLAPQYDFTVTPVRHVPISLWQVGEIPTEAKSIQFFLLGNPFEVRINGTQIQLYYEGNYPCCRLAAGDISAFAGQTVELKFITAEADRTSMSVVELNVLDNILFSPEPIPEPRTWLLLVLGAGAHWATRKTRWPS